MPSGGPPVVELRPDDCWLQGKVLPYTVAFEEEMEGPPEEEGALSAPAAAAAAAARASVAAGAPAAVAAAAAPLELRLASGAHVRIVGGPRKEAQKGGPQKSHEGPPTAPLSTRGAPRLLQQGSATVFYAALVRRELRLPNFRFKP